MKKIFFSLVMALALVSCSTEDLSNGGTPASDKGSVQLVLSTEGFDMVSRAVDESAIHDVNILEYVNGVIAPEIVYLTESEVNGFNKAVPVSGLTALPATTMTEITDADGNKIQVMNEKSGYENFIFIVANYGSKIDREKVPDLNGLKAFTMSFSGKTDMTNLPMTGFYYGGINDNSVTQMNVSLQRAVAKINFTLDTSNFAVEDGSAPSQILVNSIKLCNVPNEITLYPCQDRPSLPKNDKTGNWKGTPFPTASEMASSVTYSDEQNQSSDANTYVAYIPENARGSFSTITGNKDKHPSKCDNSITDEKADNTYTYIFVDLDYVMSDGTGKNATYRIYLGGNNTGDMNLLRNTEYYITTFLYGADPNSTDTRISTENIVFVDDMKDKPANCYMIDMSDVQSGSKKFVIPLSQVNNGWAKIAEYDATQSSTKTQVADMIKSGKWEIQTEWRTWDGSNITGTKVSDFSESNPRAVLTIPAVAKNGNNAVVKLVSKADGKTYWSWHLWFTDYKPEKSTDAERHGQIHKYFGNAFQIGTYKDKYMMDRNVGAIVTADKTGAIITVTGTGTGSVVTRPSTTPIAIQYYGLMYQWGRKDPFVGSGAGTGKFVAIWDGDNNSLSNGAAIPFKKDGPTTDVANSVYNPSTFFTANSNGDWLSPQNDDLWDKNGTSKSVFDPCPSGWRVPKGDITPTNNPWCGFGEGTASLISDGDGSPYFYWKSTSGQSGTGGRLYSYPSSGDIQSWYPATGRLSYSDGTLDGVGDYGYYWSVSTSSHRGYRLYFYSKKVTPADSNNRAFGLPVRCVQE